MLTLAALMLLASAAARATCTVSASGVVFGVYNPFSAIATDATGTVTLSCSIASGLGAYNIALSTGSGGSFAGRRMSSGSAILPYQLYSDAAHSQIWGDGTGGSATVAGADNIPLLSGTSIHQVYGRIAARQVASPGPYTDVIVVTVTY
jgi:spore coat protein U-like protein